MSEGANVVYTIVERYGIDLWLEARCLGTLSAAKNNVFSYINNRAISAHRMSNNVLVIVFNSIFQTQK